MVRRGVINCMFLAAATVLLAIFYDVTRVDALQFAAIGCGTALYHYAMRLIVGKISESAFSRAVYDPGHIWFRQKKWEPALYKLLAVRRWKNKLPTAYPESYDVRKKPVAQIIQNTCHAELVHEWIAALSFVPLLFSLWWGQLAVFFVTSLFAAMSDLVFAVLQRYNRPRLQRLQAKKTEITTSGDTYADSIRQQADSV